jgi:hypothetical protein
LGQLCENEQAKMNEQTETLVRELAEKLGTTVEHLWEVTIRQAAITAVSNGIIIALLVLIVGWAYKLVRAKTTCPQPTADHQYPSADWSEIAWIGFGFGALIATVFILPGLHETITCLLNPEYWALKQLLP